MKTNIAFTLGLTLLLGACATKPQKAVIPTQSKPTPERIAKAVALMPNDRQRVRTPEHVKTYYVGRQPSKDGRTMHEAHRVYRREAGSRWNLLPNQPPLASTGPVTHVMDLAFNAAPRSNAIEIELNRQREITEELLAKRGEFEIALATAKQRLADTQSTALMRAIGNTKSSKTRTTTPSMQAEEGTPKAPPSNFLREWGKTIEARKPVKNQ